MVAANAVVNYDVPPYAVAAGNPSRIVRMFDPEVEDWVPIAGTKDLERVAANRERLGIAPRVVRVDLGRFHHLLPAMDIGSRKRTCVGFLIEEPHGWKPLLETWSAAVTADHPLTLVIGIPSGPRSQSLLDSVTAVGKTLFGRDTPPISPSSRSPTICVRASYAPWTR